MKESRKNSNVNGIEITSLEKYKFTGDILRDMREIIEVSRRSAYQAVNLALVRRNWLLGRRIAEEEMKGRHRAEYGLEIIKKLSANLTKEYGKGFTKTNLYNYYLFFKTFPKIFQTVFGKSGQLLSWCHYLTLLRVKDEEKHILSAAEGREEPERVNRCA